MSPTEETDYKYLPVADPDRVTRFLEPDQISKKFFTQNTVKILSGSATV